MRTRPMSMMPPKSATSATSENISSDEHESHHVFSCKALIT